MATAEETEEFVEAAAVRVKLRVGAEMPLANGPSRIAGGTERIGDGGFGEWQAVGGGGGVPFGIKFVAEALLVTASENSGAGGTAHGVGDVAIGAPDARGGEAIQVRRRNIAATLEADVVVPEIIGDDEQNVRPRR